MYKLYAILAFYLFISLLTLNVFVDQHELVHVAINRNYGNCNSTISFYWWGAVTTPQNCSWASKDDINTAKFLNTENEIIGYNNQAMIIAIQMAVLVIISVLVVMSDSHEYKPHYL